MVRTSKLGLKGSFSSSLLSTLELVKLFFSFVVDKP
jgi:hypothetical protein